MPTINVHLVDEDGDFVTDSDGNKIAVGTVTTSDPITGGTFEDFLSTLDDALITDGMRLARTLRGDFLRFEIIEGATSDDWIVVYNRSILGGRFRSPETAVGQVAGTFARRGGWLLGSIIPRPEM